jgi:hypothetical protein
MRWSADVLLDMALVNAFYALTNQLRIFFSGFWRTAMEMMDLKAAIGLFDQYASMLDAQQRGLQKTRRLAKADPELAEYVTSQTESLRDSSRNYAAFSILFSKEVVQQSALVLLSDDYGDVMAAQGRFSDKLNEVCAFLEEIKEGSQPTTATPTGPQATGSPPAEHTMK